MPGFDERVTFIQKKQELEEDLGHGQAMDSDLARDL